MQFTNKMKRSATLHCVLIATTLLVLLGVVAPCRCSAAGIDTTSSPDSTQQADSSSISPLRLGLVSGVTIGGFILGHVVLSNLWWKGEKSEFRFDWEHDWHYALGADKLGHFYFPYLTTNIYRQAFAWSGIDTVTSVWLAGGVAFTYQTYIEVKDGFSKEWGFSWGDFSANLLGASYPVVQEYIPPLRDFTFKISFYPSERFRNGSNSAIIDDYESTFHWLSINVHNLLPEAWRASYPSWLNLAVGHSVTALDDRGGGEHQIFLSFDWNLDALPSGGWLWNLLKHNLNFYKLPAPAVRISPGVVWYGIHF